MQPPIGTIAFSAESAHFLPHTGLKIIFCNSHSVENSLENKKLCVFTFFSEYANFWVFGTGAASGNWWFTFVIFLHSKVQDSLFFLENYFFSCGKKSVDAKNKYCKTVN